MLRTKIDYGIDLGTTNSAIARMENGEPVIVRAASLMDTMPSCIYFDKKKSIQVGGRAFNSMKKDKSRAMKDFKPNNANSFIEFKRTMGTDKKYHSSNMDKAYSSEELSAEVLKTLKSFVTDESVKSIVVTVPAKFTTNQTDATLRAAKLAGFEQVALLQEPIAASMAYGLTAKNKNGYWLVFDFGGGTFDAALLRVEEGIMKVIDTEGDNYLGGKNLDYAIVDEIIIPFLQKEYNIQSIVKDEVKKEVLRKAMKFYAEEAKIQLSFNETHNILSDLGDIPGEDDEGEEFELDIEITQNDLKKVLAPIFQKAIDICKDLLQRNNLQGNSLDSLILVGGPTYSPILRKMLEEQITKPDTSTDPMTVVSKGAALYASTIDSKTVEIDPTKIQLELGYETTTVEEEEFVTVKILKDKTEGEIPNKIFADIVRNDKAWSSGKQEIGDKGDIIEVKLNGGSNLFNIITYNETGDIIPCQPDNFLIIGDTKPPVATLPYHIGIEIKSKASGKVVFKAIKGLEKNQSTPATGTISGLKTQKQIRPGKKEDFIKIPVYQGEHNAEGSKAIYNERVYDVIVSGEELPSILPENSDVDLTLKVDNSGIITLSAFFPTLDFTYDFEPDRKGGIQKEIDAIWLNEEIQKAKQTLHLIEQERVYQDKQELEKINSDLANLEKRFEQGKTDNERKKDVLDSLRRVLRKLEKIGGEVEWPKTEEELKDVFYRLEENSKKLDSDKIDSQKLADLVAQFKEQIPQVIKEKNVKVAQDLIDNMRSLDFQIMKLLYGVKLEINYIYSFNEDFDMIEWKQGAKPQARQLINEGMRIVNDNPTVEKLKPIVVKLLGLMVKVDEGFKYNQGDGSELVGI